MTPPPFAVDHSMLGRWVRWPDGREGVVAAIWTNSAEGTPHTHPTPEQTAHAGRLRAIMILIRRDPTIVHWPITDLDELTGAIRARKAPR